MYDADVTDKEKASKLLRTLPEAFASFALVAQTNDLILDKFIVSIKGTLSRRKKKATVIKGPQLMEPLAQQWAKREKMDVHSGPRRPSPIGHVSFAVILGIL